MSIIYPEKAIKAERGKHRGKHRGQVFILDKVQAKNWKIFAHISESENPVCPMQAGRLLTKYEKTKSLKEK